ncbi:MAG: 16S rRNA (cytosine(967)-C(5))-methyltransferase RsmB [Deltaproteobacteria bacterium]|nr:16S rRNA (cytosine(967)-C(5))-methyltransferase RsmB [Deltaproteobacteria bacterium]
MTRGAAATGPTARGVARQVRARVADGAYATLALAGELDRSGLSAADRALATELCYGVLRLRGRLDRALEACAPRGLGRVDQRVRDALRVAAFQMLCLQRVPAHAAVNDAVEEVKRLRGPRLAGFANALLRKLARDGEPAAPAPDADPVAFMVARESYPEWLARLYLAEVGPEEAVAFAAAQNTAAPVWLRANPARGGRAEALRAIAAERPDAELHASPLLPEALRLRGASSPAELGAFRDGLCTVQDLGAQAVGRLCGAAPGERILDACAGVGGKSTHLAELAAGGALIDAADRSARKLALLIEHARRLGAAGITPVEVDLAAPGARLAAAYDRVLLDAPCTGLGVLRRHPELKWRREAADVARLAAVQAQLLGALAPRVRVGGVLVYSVCTVTPAEGAGQVARFLERHPGFRLEAPDEPAVAPLLDAHGLLRTLPHRHDADGFVAARLRRHA